MKRNDLLTYGLTVLTASTALIGAGGTAQAAGKQPNILILWGDDIGYWNISANNQGMMGYKTPNIDRIAKEGANFTDWYGQQSCTAGRACFITGQSGFRTGLLKVGLPGAKEGLQARDVTIAQLLKARGYMTAQFGKNHLGDADDTLPTAHGFDEFMGSLYHLNAEQEPEHPDYFKDPAMIKKYNTRGVLHCWANPDGTQRIESTGPLNIKRMETIDEEVTKRSLEYLEEAIEPGSVNNDIFSHEDMLPTLLAAAGDPDVKEKLLKGMKVGEKTFKVHLDGYNITDALAGKAPDPRHEFFYFNDDGSLVCMRYDQWKIIFAEQRSHGFDVWREPFTPLRIPRMINLRADPFEEGEHGWTDWEWTLDHAFLLVPAQQFVGKFLMTFQEFPPSQKVGSFSLDKVLESLSNAQTGGK